MSDQYEVDYIICENNFGRGKEYLIKWESYDFSECTWEPAENVLGEYVLEMYKEKSIVEKLKEKVAKSSCGITKKAVQEELDNVLETIQSKTKDRLAFEEKVSKVKINSEIVVLDGEKSSSMSSTYEVSKKHSIGQKNKVVRANKSVVSNSVVENRKIPIESNQLQDLVGKKRKRKEEPVAKDKEDDNCIKGAHDRSLSQGD
jgi:hypothetical protein